MRDRLGGVGPAPSVGEGVELHLAYRAAWLAEENVVIGVRIKRRIEINKIDTGIREPAPDRAATSNCRQNTTDSLPFSTGSWIWMQ